MFAVAFTTAYDRDARLVSFVLSIAGVLITLAWLYVNWRHKVIVEHVQNRARESLREFRKTYSGAATAEARATDDSRLHGRDRLRAARDPLPDVDPVLRGDALAVNHVYTRRRPSPLASH
jgi:hypothetical protein